MSNATFTPAKSAVTKTVVVTPAVPAKVTLELTPAQATVVMGLLGVTSGDTSAGPYTALYRLADCGDIQKPNFDKVYAALGRKGKGADAINSDKDFV